MSIFVFLEGQPRVSWICCSYPSLRRKLISSEPLSEFTPNSRMGHLAESHSTLAAPRPSSSPTGLATRSRLCERSKVPFGRIPRMRNQVDLCKARCLYIPAAGFQPDIASTAPGLVRPEILCSRSPFRLRSRRSIRGAALSASNCFSHPDSTGNAGESTLSGSPVTP